MKYTLTLTALLFANITFAQILDTTSSGVYQVRPNGMRVKVGNPLARVDFDDFEKVMALAKEHRKTHLVDLDQFVAMSKETGVMILDARSDSMFNLMHIKGAVHLNFSDFTQENLARAIPSFDTKVLIYCNNNFEGIPIPFPDKAVKAPTTNNLKGLTLALNIPTFINLYGYGYRNVYELKDLIDSNTRYDVEFEGALVSQR